MAYNPLLVIGLGGTGTNIARNLRDILAWRYEDAARLPIRFLCYDTHVASLARVGLPGTQLTVPGETILRMREDPAAFDDDIALTEWAHIPTLNRATEDGFVEGAANVRMFGRLAFLASGQWNLMCRQIHDAIKELDALDSAELVKPPRAIVVASAAGGTGSGTFIDMGYLVRKILREKFPGANWTTVGIVAIPPANVPVPTYRRNAAAMLDELDRCVDPSVKVHIRYPRTVHIDNRDEVTAERPYTDVCLVAPMWGAHHMDGGITELEWRLAHLINEDFHAHLTDVYGERRNLRGNYGVADETGYHYGFATFGMSTIEFPAEVCHRACVYRTIGLFVDELLKWSPEAGETTWQDRRELFHRLGLVHQLGEMETSARHDPLWECLTETAPGEPRPDGAIAEAIERHTASGRGTEALDDLREELEAQFKPVPAAAGQRDRQTFRAVVEANQPNLTAGETEAQKLAILLARVALTPGCGPEYAVRLVDQLDAAVRAEIREIDDALEDARVDWDSVVGAAAERVEQVEEDWLLLPWRGWALRRALRRVKAAAYHYANCRVESLVLPIKKLYYQKVCDRLLPTMRRRLSRLHEYIVSWRERCVGRDGLLDQAMALAGTGNILFDEATVDDKVALVFYNAASQPEQRRRALAALASENNLGELIAALTYPDWESGQGAFDEGLPTDLVGGVDYRLVEPIERELKEKFRPSRLPDGRPLIYGEDVIELFNRRALTKEGGPTGQVRQAIVRSQEYLPLDTADQVYRAMVNGPTFPKAPPYEWWAFHYAADPGSHADPLHETFREMIDEQAKQVAFAEHIDLDKGTMVQRPIGDQYRVLFLRDRAGYPSRLIAGYDPVTRAGLVDAGTFARTRTDWPPIIDPPVLAQCRQLVVGCVVCRLLTPQGGQFVYEVPQRPGTPKQEVRLSRRFSDAVSTLAGEREWQEILRDLVDERRTGGGRARLEEAAQQLVEQLDIRDKESRALAAARGLQDIADNEAYEHIRGFCARFGLSLPPPPPPRWVEWRKEGAELANGRTALQDGWYCRNAKCAFLYSVEPDPVPDERECPACHATGIG